MTDSPARGGLFLSRNRLLIFAGLLLAFVAVQWQWPRLFGPTAPDAGDALIWHPSLGQQNPDGSWRITLHGRVFAAVETEEAPAVQALRAQVPPDIRSQLDRIGGFRLRELAARGLAAREIVVRYGLRRFRVGSSDASGVISGSVDVPADLVGDGTTWRFETLLRAGDPRKIRGVVHLLRETGWSIVSRIDHVARLGGNNRPAERLRAWLAPHEAVPGMARVFQGWEQAAGARFHYVADRPWATFAETRDFLASAGFPAGSMHLRPATENPLPLVRAQPLAARLAKLEPLVARFPRREFVLLGTAVDESDLETFAALARKHPGQIRHVFLRLPQGVEEPSAARIEEASKGLPDGLKIRLFSTPDTLPKNL